MGGFCLIICSFWGHQTLYDLDLADRVQNAIAQVVAQDDEIEFRLFSTGSFAPICLSAAMEAKQRYRNKRISLVLIRMPRPDTAAWADSTDPLPPLCAFERILQTAPCHNAQEALQVIHHLLRQSHYLIRYWYAALSEPQLLQLSIPAHCRVLDLADAQTAQAITDDYCQLSEAERLVVEATDRGLSLSAACTQLHLSLSITRQLHHAARQKLRFTALSRMARQFIANGPDSHKTCGVLSLRTTDEIAPALLDAFSQIVQFLILRLHVTHFLVEQTQCFTVFGQHLCGIAQTFPEVEVTAVTHYPDLEPTAWQQVRASYWPQFQRVQNLPPNTRSIRAQHLRTGKAIVDRSDYLICELGRSTGIAPHIEKYVYSNRHVKIWDLGHRPEREIA